MRRSITASFIALAALGVLVVPAHGGFISGNFSGHAALKPIAPNVFFQTFSGSGDDTSLGSFTVKSHSKIDFSNPSHIILSDAMFAETFSGGMLDGTSTGMGAASGHGTASFKAEFVFTGGTGFFAGATGEATVTGTIVRTGPTTVTVTGSYFGSLVPEPGSLALLASAVAVGLGVLVRARRRVAGDK